METFRWKIDPDMGVESEPLVSVTKFGDGYEQRRPAGLNNNLEKYSVTIRVKRGEVRYLRGFLNRHAGVKSFMWTPPYSYQPIKVVCRKWSSKVGMLNVTFTTIFEQVVV